MNTTPQIKIRRRVLSTLVLLAVLLMNVSTVIAAPMEDADSLGTAFEAHLGHPSDDGFSHQGHSEKCHLMKHLTLRFDGAGVLLSWNKERIADPIQEVVVGLLPPPPFRPPTS